MKKAIINGKIILKDSILEDKNLIYNQKIMDILDSSESLGEDVAVLDAKGCYVSPGLIDIHVHGLAGRDTMDGSIDSIRVISNEISSNGVTTFLPTSMTMDLKSVTTALDAVRAAMRGEVLGARVEGVHLEGPFISVDYKGAQNDKYIISPYYGLVESYKDVIKIITMAPEMDAQFDFINRVKLNESIVLSMGHTGASYDEAMKAINAGVTCATHLFNAMSGFHHRNPGVVGAALGSDIYCEIIADNLHVHPMIYDMVGRCKGPEKLILISDSIRGTCMEEGEYDLGGHRVKVSSQKACLSDGTLAGSVLRLNEAIRNVKENSKYSLPQIINMASLNPASLLGIKDTRGSIDIGKDADLTILDAEFNVMETLVGGRFTYRRGERIP